MKKLAVLFIVLISLVVIAGCNTSKKTVTRFSSDSDETGDNGTTTTITTLDNDTETETAAAIEIPDTDEEETNEEEDSESEDDAVFAVTVPSGDSVVSDKGYHLIQGTTPKNTDKILVNGNAVTKYKAGSTQWNYIAAASLGTLKKGQNNYTVKALDEDGDELGSKSFTIVYKGIENGALANTGNSSILFSIVLALVGYLALSFRRPALTRIQK